MAHTVSNIIPTLKITKTIPLLNVKASSLPKSNHLVQQEHCRGWKILHQLMKGLRQYNEIHGHKKTPRIYQIVTRLSCGRFRKSMAQCNQIHQMHQRRDVQLTFMAIKHSRMSMMEQMHEEAQKDVPTVEELVKRLKYTKNYLKLKKEVGDQRIAEKLAVMRSAGLELRNVEAGDTGKLTEISRYARIEPRLRTVVEREYLVHWIESKLPKGGVINNLFKRCDLPTKNAFIAGLKYRYYSKKTAMVYQNEEAHEFFILISGSVEVWVNKDLSIDPDNIADFVTKGTRVAVLPNGFSFGEASLKGHGAKRQATIIAQETCEVLIATQSLFDAIIKQFNVSSKARAIAALNGIWPFKGQRSDVLDKMGSCFDLVNVPPDLEIYSQGKTTQNVYVLVEGQCKELLYFQKTKEERQSVDGSRKQVLRIKDPAAVKELEPQPHSVCHSSAIVVSRFSEQRLMGAFEVINEVPCLTSIVTVGACKALKAQIPMFLKNIRACPVLRQRILERARLQKLFIMEREEQYRNVMQCHNENIRSVASFALNNRSYVHTPRAFLNKNMRRKGISGLSEKEDGSQHRVGDLYQAQHIENISKESTARASTGQNVTTINFEKEKLRLDLKSISNVKQQIEQYSARYKERMKEREQRKAARQRWRRKCRLPHKAWSEKKYHPLCAGKMSESDEWLLEGFSIQKIQKQEKKLKNRLHSARVDTSKSIHESDMRRMEFLDRVKYEARRRPQSARISSKKKRRKKQKSCSGKMIEMNIGHFPPCTALRPVRPKTAPCVDVGQWCSL